MQKWEYKAIHQQGVLVDAKQAELNKLGEEGWELIAIADYVFYFKRPLAA